MEKEELGLQVNQLKMQIEEKEGLIDEAQMSKINSNGEKMREIMSKEIERIKASKDQIIEELKEKVRQLEENL